MTTVASIFIFLSVTIYGFYLSERSVYKLRDFKQFKKALLMLQAEIKFSNEILSKACVKISEKVDTPINLIFLEFGNLLEEEIYTDINDLWCASIEKYNERLYFTSDEILELKSLSTILGESDIDMQLKNISLLIEYIDKEVEELHKLSYKESKMYKSISVLTSFLIIILLA